MLGLPPRHPRRRIAVGSSARLSRLHVTGSRLGLNVLGCDESDGVIAGRAGLQRRLSGFGRKLSLPVMSRAEQDLDVDDLSSGLGVFAIGPQSKEDFASPDAEALMFRPSAAACSSEPASRRSPAPQLTEEDASECASGWSQPTDPPACRSTTRGGASASRADDSHGAAADESETASAERSGGGPRNKVFASNIPYNASKAQLREVFEHFGAVSNVHVVKNPTNGRPKGFAFITFKDASSADNCLAADLSPQLYLHRRQMRVSRAQPRRQANTRSKRRPAAAPFQPSGPCYVDELPNELLHHIFSYLSVAQQLELQHVSRRWQQAVRSLFARRQRLDLEECISPQSGKRLTDGLLKRLLKLMPALRHLRTGGLARSCTWKALEIVASCCRHLVEIDLDGFCINESSLKKLCVSCPELETVQLPHQYHFSESSVWVLVRHLQRLRVLDLNNSGRVTGDCFSLLPASLERLVLAECVGLRSSALRHLERCPRLLELDVSAVTSVQTADLAAALQACPALQRLTVRRLHIAPEKYVPEQGLPQLRHLDAAFAFGVTDSTLRQLPHLLPQLHTLSLQGCSGLTEEGLMHLHRLKQLRSLDLGYVKSVTDAVLVHICNPHLSQLHLPEGYSGPAGFTADGIQRAVLDYRSLTLLDLSGVQLVTHQLLERLRDQLSSERDVTLYIGGTDAQMVCNVESGVWGARPLRAQDTNTVPMHMRGYADDDYPSGSEYDYDSDLDDLDMIADVYGDMYAAGYDSDMYDMDYELGEDELEAIVEAQAQMDVALHWM